MEDPPVVSGFYYDNALVKDLGTRRCGCCSDTGTAAAWTNTEQTVLLC